MAVPSRYIAPIDGLRAIAVVAVILYHLGLPWIPGGFLGVDLFFVISGYVITRLLLDSILSKGALDLREFYWARIRRLAPPLIFMLAGTSFIIALWKPDAIHRYLSDLPYVLTGSENWHLVAVHQDYFQAIGRPPLLQHTWSLAVEIQFYILWPLILLAILRYFGKKSVVKVSLAIAFISGLTLFIYSLKVDATQTNLTQTNRINHIYFGTDTHSLGLFLGAALAVSWIPKNLNKNISQRAQDFVDGVGVIGFLGLLCTFFFIDESNPALYRIAFPLAAIFGCATITSLVHPASRFSPLLSARPMVWIGQRSYGIYLWHWVVFQVSRPNVDLAGASWAINSARILIVIALADISLRWVEIPIRRGQLSNWFRGMKYRTPATRRLQKFWILLSILVFTTATVGASWAAFTKDRNANKEATVVTNPVTPNTLNPTTPNPVNSNLSSSNPSSTKAITKTGLWVTGDSVILGIRAKLENYFPIALINARVGRQIGELIQVVQNDRVGLENSTVILDLGNNNHLTESDVRTLFELLKNQPKIIVVDTAVPRVWRDDNNRIIRKVIADYPQSRLVDWATISLNHPEYFAPDGVHLDDAGGDVYVNAILEALK